MSSTYFFALAEDWPPILKAVEATLAVHLASAGHFPTTETPRFSNLGSVPNLGIADGAQTAQCARYLIYLVSNPIAVSYASTTVGDIYVVDELINPTAITFTPAGKWRDEAIIAGSVGSAHDTPDALKIMKAFRKAFSTRFHRVKSFWVGDHALASLRTGFRLTQAVQSPCEFDLAE